MASELFSKANEEFVNENYGKALKLYTEAVESDDSQDDVFACRAHAYIKLQQYKEAEQDADKAISLNPKNVKAFFRKGIALFHQEKYTGAKEVFSQGQKLDSEDNNFKTWIEKCDAKSSSSLAADLATAASAATASPSGQTETSPVPSVPVQRVTPPIRQDWYQTATHVVVVILVKQAKKDDLTTDIQEKCLSVKIKPPSADNYSTTLRLAHSIDPTKSSVRVVPSKIEIKLKKNEGLQWSKLESDDKDDTVTIKQISTTGEEGDVHKYPSSSVHKHNWDLIEHEVEEEEKTEQKEGDAALQNLFQKIYADGNDEVKKAMAKSFYESGGTVLSTNWGEVGGKKVDVKPPDGMEYRQWES
ncbi:hypothetical protein ScPMuIL_010502 [Solemya velum]